MGRVRRDPVMAGERQFEGPAEAEPVDRRREGLAAGLQPPEQQGQPARFLEEAAHRRLLALLRAQLLVGSAQALKHGEIGAAGEVLLAGGNHAALDRRVRSNSLHNRREFLHHRFGDDVHRTAGHVPSCRAIPSASASKRK